MPSDIQQDPSADNFVHFRDEDFDNSNEMVLNRYKYFNGTSGNSPVDENSTYIKSATTIPDIEDINRDNTMGEGESYYEYHISMRPQDLEVADQLAVKMQQRTRLTWNGFVQSYVPSKFNRS